METSVSNIETYRIWKAAEDLDISWLIQRLTVREQTAKMKAGEAFHKALEKALETEHYAVSAMGHSFSFLCDAEISLPKLRECSISKDYDGLLVRARVDAISGRTVTDIKTTEDVDFDRYMESYQWRFYLDITGADRFEWPIFQMREVPSDDATICFDVFGFHKLIQYRYDGLHEDCVRAAQEYKEFAERHLPPIQSRSGLETAANASK